MIGEIVNEILKEIDRAVVLHPVFPADPIHQCAIMAEEAGEAIRACNDMVHEGGGQWEYEVELRQTAAMCIRCLAAIRK
jgi:hypothetical protein